MNGTEEEMAIMLASYCQQQMQAFLFFFNLLANG
jgi:hypothetical protein